MSMRRLSLLSLLLSIVFAAIYIALRALFGQEQHYFLYALSIALGLIIGSAADCRNSAVAVALLAALGTVIVCAGGIGAVGALEKRATLIEFRRFNLESDEFFIALEAYHLEYANKSGAPEFPKRCTKGDYAPPVWKKAEDIWHTKPAAEQNATRQEWKDNWKQLNEFMQVRVRDSFLARWYLSLYAKAVAIAGGLAGALVFTRRQESEPQGW